MHNCSGVSKSPSLPPQQLIKKTSLAPMWPCVLHQATSLLYTSFTVLLSREREDLSPCGDKTVCSRQQNCDVFVDRCEQ
jgi:hypothetical protein